MKQGTSITETAATGLFPTGREIRKRTEITTRLIKSEATNLRRDRYDPQVWRRAGMPRKIAGVNALPLASVTLPVYGGRGVLLIGHNNSLYCRIDRLMTEDDIQTPEEMTAGKYIAGEPRLLTQLPATPLLADCSTEGVIRLMLNHSPDVYITYADTPTPTLSYHGEMPQLPEIRLTATDYNTLYEQLPTVALTGTSSGASGSQLSEADSLRVANALTAAYDTLRSRARGMDYCVQPVMARYRILDAGGKSIAVGPLVTIADPDGYSATGSIQQISTDGMQTLTGGAVEMKVYRPGYVVAQPLSAPWNRLAAKMIIEITDEIDPLTKGTGAPHGVHRDAASGRVTVTSRMPGFGNGTVLDRIRLTDLALQSAGAKMRTVAELPLPFLDAANAAGSVKSFSGTAAGQPSEATGGVAQTVSKSYSAGIATGGLTILCNPRQEVFAGWSPEDFIMARGAASGEWRMAFTVTISTPAGEKTVTRETVSREGVPTALLPTLIYPSEDATALTVSYLSPAGEAFGKRYPLTPIAGRGIAVYISPALEKLSPAPTGSALAAYNPPPSTAAPVYREGVADVYPSSDTGQLLDSRRVSDKVITAVREVPRSGSGWDFSRSKLLFFGFEGIKIATVNSRGGFNSVAPVDNRPVRYAAGICDGDGQRGAALRVIAGDSLLELSGQQVTTTAIPPLPYPPVAAGWNSRYSELWLLCSDGSLYRLSQEGELLRVDLPGIAQTMSIPVRFAAFDGELLLGCDGGVFNLSEEQQTDALAIQLTQRCQVSLPPEELTLNIFSKAIDGKITLSGDNGTEIPQPLLELRLSGAVNAPIKVRLAAPRRRWIEMSCRLTAAPDLAIHPYGLT